MNLCSSTSQCLRCLLHPRYRHHRRQSRRCRPHRLLPLVHRSPLTIIHVKTRSRCGSAKAELQRGSATCRTANESASRHATPASPHHHTHHPRSQCHHRHHHRGRRSPLGRRRHPAPSHRHRVLRNHRRQSRAPRCRQAHLSPHLLRHRPLLRSPCRPRRPCLHRHHLHRRRHQRRHPRPFSRRQRRRQLPSYAPSRLQACSPSHSTA